MLISNEQIRVIIEGTPSNCLDNAMSIATVVLALCAIVISIFSYRSQRTHNIQSVRPVLNVVLGDYENKTYVKITNNGIGPATIRCLKCTYEGSLNIIRKESNALIDILNQDGAYTKIIEYYSDFVEDISDRTISPGESIVLVSKVNGSKIEIHAMRLMLKDIVVTVEYKDIYEKSFVCMRKLDFFGRRVES